MKHLKTYENINDNLQIGDYVICKGSSFSSGEINYFYKKRQEKLEMSYMLAISKFAQKIPIKIQPIIHVNIPGNHDDNDLGATKRIINNLKKYGLKINKEIIIKDLDSAIKTYGGISLLLGMRMHSNIIAATQGVPFVAVAYEYKTQGIARDLGAEITRIR